MNSEIAGTLGPGQVLYVPFSITTPKHGRAAHHGLYEVDLFVKAPRNEDCGGLASGASLAVLDRDDSIVNAYVIGEQISESTSDPESWQKVSERFDFPAETFRLRLSSLSKHCSVHYRVRLTSSSPPAS